MNCRSSRQRSLADAGPSAWPFIPGRAAASGRKDRAALIGPGWFGGNTWGEAMASDQGEIIGVRDFDPPALDPFSGKVIKGCRIQPQKDRITAGSGPRRNPSS